MEIISSYLDHDDRYSMKNNFGMKINISRNFQYFDYVVRQGPSASPATGPAHDHTLKTAEGHYLLLEASKKRFLSRAEIMSPPLDIAPYPEYCFSLWYLMFGRHTFRVKFKIFKISEFSLRPIDIVTICNGTTLLLS